MPELSQIYRTPRTVPQHLPFPHLPTILRFTPEKIKWIELRTQGGRKQHFNDQLCKSFCRKFHDRMMVFTVEELWVEYNRVLENDSHSWLDPHDPKHRASNLHPSPASSVDSDDVSFGGLRLNSEEAMFLQSYTQGRKHKIDDILINCFMAKFRENEPRDSYTREQFWLALCKFKGRNPADPTGRAYPREHPQDAEIRVAQTERHLRRQMAQKAPEPESFFGWLCCCCGICSD